MENNTKSDTPIDNEQMNTVHNVSNGYPEKPLEEQKQQPIYRSLMSMALFIAAFYFIFRWDFTYILVLAGVVLIHEIGHYLAMRIFKYNDLSIFFVPLV